MKPIYQRAFRYTFQTKPILNMKKEQGLYEFEGYVLAIDPFGEVRLSQETPINNPNILIKKLRRAHEL